MKDILLNFKGFEKNTIFTNENVDDLNGPWKHLKKRLAEVGYDLKTVDDNDLTKAERIIFVDEVTTGNKKRDKSTLRSLIKKILGKDKKIKEERPVYAEGLRLGLKANMALLLWEAKAIDPDNYTEDTYDKFPTIITWKDDIVDNKKFFKFYHPYSDRERLKPSIEFKDKKMLVNISMNKLSYFPNELYSERKKSIMFFEKALGSQFDLFGYNWNKPITKQEKIFPFLVKKFKSYRGVCGSKHEILSQYKFSLCYENVKNEKGYITEKIFDCFNARTVPIYWGADNVTEYIPEDIFIDRRNFNSDTELLNFLNSINDKEYSKYIAGIEIFLNSDKYKKFLPESFFTSLTKALKL